MSNAPKETLRDRVLRELGSVDRPFALLTILRTQTVEGGDRLETAMKTVVAESRKEAGNRTYHVNRDAADPTRFFLYDRWDNVAATETHEAAPHFKDGLVVLREVLDRIESVTVLRIAAEQ